MAFETGKTYHGFVLIDKHDISEVNSKGLLFEHEKSGARLVKLENSDDNKLFSITFRTPPQDSRGLPHILEHSVLCGSRKFPSKEPFIELLKGSLKTFLNAMTFPDKTMYPIASRNTKDFFNLMDVYLDAVLYPNLLVQPEIMMQEGWHYELNSPEEEITYKGVVYNEMRGAYSTPEAMLTRKIFESLFPDTAYGADSGGDPDVIPELTQEQFCAFHSEYYHPSNSYIHLYGDGDTMKELKFINDEYLQDFNSRNVNSVINLQTAFNKPVEISIDYPVSKEETEEGKTYLCLSWVTARSTDPDLCLAFEILEHLLLDTPAAPLKRALLESGLGKDVFGQYTDSLLQTPFSVVLKNSNEDRKDEFKNVVFKTLHNLVERGIDKKLIEASINSMEFELREADYQGYPKGLFYAMKSLSTWLHGETPFTPLEYEPALEILRRGLTENYFEELIEEYLLKNNHRSLLILRPRKGLEEDKNTVLRKELADYKATLSAEQIEGLVEQTKALSEHQNIPDTPEALAKIPCLSRGDIKSRAEELPLVEKEEAGIPVLAHYLFTNNIAYLNLYFDSGVVPAEDLPYLALLTRVVSRTDTENHDYSDLANELNIHTGGIDLDIAVYKHIHTGAMMPCLEVQSRALIHELPRMIELLGEVLGHTDFSNTSRLKDIIQEMKSRLEMHINFRSHVIARLRLFSYMSPADQYSEQIEGLALYRAISDMADNFDNRVDRIKNKLAEIDRLVFNRNNLLASITIGEKDYPVFQKEFPALFEHLASDIPVPVEYSFETPVINEGLYTPGKVQYVAKGFDFSQLGYEYTGVMQVVSTISQLTYLWNRIRVQGGAYGVFAQFARDGRFFLGSFRDPNLTETLEVFDGLPEFLRNTDFGKKEITKFVLGSISSLDQPLTPSMKGIRAAERWITGITHEDVQKIRDQVIETTHEDIVKLADLIEDALNKNYFCVVGSEGKIKENKDIFNDLIQVFE